MGLRLPQNQIVYKYTAGKEYMYITTYKEYQGYYYEFNGSAYAGKEYNTAAPELIKMKSDNVNTLLLNPNTYLYGKISNIKITKPKITTTNSIIESQTKDIVQNYFIRNTTILPITIKQVNKETYNELKNNSLYQSTSINSYPTTDFIYFEKDLERAEKELPGIKAFLLG